MIRFDRLRPWAVIIALSCIDSSAYAFDGDPESNPAAGAPATGQGEAKATQDLPARIRAAKSRFTPRKNEDLTPARNRLRSSAAALRGYLATGGANGRAWMRFLLWDELQSQLGKQTAPESADLAELERVYRRYVSDHDGLERPIWRNVAQALRAYIDLGAELADAHPQATYETQLDRLADGLEAYARTASPEDLDAAALSLGSLERTGRALPLVRAIRERFSQPNLYVNISADFISAGTGRLVDETEPVRDTILGTQIAGQGRTVGRVQVKLVPSTNRAVLETVLEGVNYAQTIGANGPARIGSNSRTVLVGRQPLTIDADGFHALAGVASASAHSQIYGVWSTKRGCVDRLVRKVAWKRIPKQKRQSEQIASSHAKRRLSRRMNEELRRELQASNANFLEKFRNPLLRVGQLPRRLDFSTTEGELRLVGLHDGLGRLAAPAPPPETNGQTGVLVRFHESLPNNFAQGLLAGQTLDRDQFEQLSLRYLGRVPKELQDDEPKGPWSITFAAHGPITVRIDQGVATITIRGRQFSSDVRRFDEPMNVTAHYQLDRVAGAIKAVRQGELEIFPPGFVPNAGRRLPTRLIGFRNLLKHRFEKLLAPEIVSPGLVLSGPWHRVGKLELTELQAAKGWMLLGWQPSSGDSRLASQTSPRN